MGALESLAVLSIVISAKDEAESILNKVKGEAKGAGEEGGGGLGAGLAKGAMIGGAAIAAVGGAVVAFGISSMHHVEEVGQAAYEMGEKFGMSGKEATTWIGIGEQLGISSGQISSSFQKMDRSLISAEAAQTKANKTGKASSDIYTQLGVQITDTSGKMLSQTDIVRQLAEKFSQMPDGPQKTADAMKIFGRAGAELLPMLNEGAAGLDKFTAAAIANGAVLSNDEVKAAHDSFLAHKELDAAMSSLGNQIGLFLMPKITTLTLFFTQSVIPVVRDVINWFASKLQPAFDILSKFIVERMLPPIKEVAAWFGDKLPIAMKILKGILDILWGVWTAQVKVFVDVVHWLRDVIPPVLSTLYDWFKTYVIPILMVFVGVVRDDIPAALSAMYDWFNKSVIPAFIDYIKSTVIPALGDLVNWFKNLIPGSLSDMSGSFTSNQGVIGGVVDALKGFASGLTTAWNEHKDQLMAALVAIAGFFDKYLRQPLQDVVTFIASTVVAGLQGLITVIGSVATKIYENRDAIKAWLEWILDHLIKNGLDVLKGSLGALLTVLGFLKDHFWIVELAAAGFLARLIAIKTVEMVTWFSGIITKAAEAASAFVLMAGQQGIGAAISALLGLSGAGGGIANAIIPGFNDASAAVTRSGQAIADFGNSFGQMAQGFESVKNLASGTGKELMGLAGTFSSTGNAAGIVTENFSAMTISQGGATSSSMALTGAQTTLAGEMVTMTVATDTQVASMTVAEAAAYKHAAAMALEAVMSGDAEAGMFKMSTAELIAAASADTATASMAPLLIAMAALAAAVVAVALILDAGGIRTSIKNAFWGMDQEAALAQANEGFKKIENDIIKVGIVSLTSADSAAALAKGWGLVVNAAFDTKNIDTMKDSIRNVQHEMDAVKSGTESMVESLQHMSQQGIPEAAAAISGIMIPRIQEQGKAFADGKLSYQDFTTFLTTNKDVQIAMDGNVAVTQAAAVSMAQGLTASAKAGQMSWSDMWAALSSDPTIAAAQAELVAATNRLNTDMNSSDRSANEERVRLAQNTMNEITATAKSAWDQQVADHKAALDKMQSDADNAKNANVGVINELTNEWKKQPAAIGLTGPALDAYIAAQAKMFGDVNPGNAAIVKSWTDQQKYIENVAVESGHTYDEYKDKSPSFLAAIDREHHGLAEAALKAQSLAGWTGDAANQALRIPSMIGIVFKITAYAQDGAGVVTTFKGVGAATGRVIPAGSYTQLIAGENEEEIIIPRGKAGPAWPLLVAMLGNSRGNSMIPGGNPSTDHRGGGGASIVSVPTEVLQPIVLQIDGREIARVTSRYQGQAMRDQGAWMGSNS